MADLSRRMMRLLPGGSDGWEVYHRARAMRLAGRDVVDLTIGEPDAKTDPRILAAMDASARGGHTGYAALRGTEALRDAIAERVTVSTGVATGRDGVLVCAGGQAALFAALMAVCDPGDDVLFPDPYYTTYPGTVRAASAVPVPVPCAPADGFAPTRAGLVAAATDRMAALLVNSPNNPTGTVYGAETLEAVAGFARDRDLWLISDEVYDTQVWTGAHLSPRALSGMAARTLVIGSLSKSHAMTGSRIGWLAGPEAAIDRVAGLVTHTTFGVPGFVQDAGAFALSLGPGFEAEVAAPFRRRRDACLARLDGQRAVGAVASGGAMYLMLDIRATGLSGRDFAMRLLDRHGIAAMPGESFGAAAAGHLRLALTRPDAVLLAALDTILTFATETGP